MNTEHFDYYRREFLNDEGYHTVALVMAMVGKHAASVTIGDCSRQVTLEFDVHEEVAAEKDLCKLDRLISTLREFRSALAKRNRRLRSARRPR